MQNLFGPERTEDPYEQFAYLSQGQAQGSLLVFSGSDLVRWSRGRAAARLGAALSTPPR